MEVIKKLMIVIFFAVAFPVCIYQKLAESLQRNWRVQLRYRYVGNLQQR